MDHQASPSTAEPDQVVYIVDDDEAVRFALILLIETCGWQANACESVEEFARIYGANPRPGCLVLDLNMQGATGADLVETLDPALPVIVITGYADSPLAERARRAGVRAILRKPFNDQLLVGHIREALTAAAA